MKRTCLYLSFLLVLAAGCAGPTGTLSSSGDGAVPAAIGPQGFVRTGVFIKPAEFFKVAADDRKDTPETSGQEGEADNEAEEDQIGEAVTIADPLEPFNRAMFTFNDRLYFWVLKPVAQGYNKVVPETARVSVRNFFDNIKFPIRFVNNLLQANFEGAVSELGRFTVNTFWGIGGLLDPASKEEIAIQRYDADLGQTLGKYGVGQGFYIVYPVLGPSSARDTASLVDTYFLDPVAYLDPWYAWIGTKTYENVNDVSLRIGDYEALKEAAIDPYLSLRDAYAQYRDGKVRQEAGKEPPKPGGVR